MMQFEQGGKKRIQQPETNAMTQQSPYYNPGNPNNIAYQPMQQYIPIQQNLPNPYLPNGYFPNGYFQTLNNV